MKNTSDVEKATLDQMPSPNHSINIGAMTTRGIELNEIIAGESNADELRSSPSQNPPASPSRRPAVNDSNVSSNVTHKCSHIVPVTNQSTSCFHTSIGWPKKKGGRILCAVKTSHAIKRLPYKRIQATSSRGPVKMRFPRRALLIEMSPFLASEAPWRASLVTSI